MTKDCWFKDMNKVNTSKDCWFKDTSKGGPPSNKGKKGKGKGKGKGKNSVNEVTTRRSRQQQLQEELTLPVRSRLITQDDSLYLFVPDCLHGGERQRGVRNWIRAGNDPTPVIPSVQRLVRCTRHCGQLCGRACVFPVRLRMDCTKTKQESNLVSASGHKLKHYGQQAVPM